MGDALETERDRLIACATRNDGDCCCDMGCPPQTGQVIKNCYPWGIFGTRPIAAKLVRAVLQRLPDDASFCSGLQYIAHFASMELTPPDIMNLAAAQMVAPERAVRFLMEQQPSALDDACAEYVLQHASSALAVLRGDRQRQPRGDKATCDSTVYPTSELQWRVLRLLSSDDKRCAAARELLLEMCASSIPVIATAARDALARGAAWEKL